MEGSGIDVLTRPIGTKEVYLTLVNAKQVGIEVHAK